MSENKDWSPHIFDERSNSLKETPMLDYLSKLNLSYNKKINEFKVEYTLGSKNSKPNSMRF